MLALIGVFRYRFADMPPPHKHRRIPSSAIASFIRHESIDALLAPYVPDPRDREWVVRCMLDEGPAHHRGANYVLLSLLGEILARLPAPAAPPPPGREVRVPMRVPPHLRRQDDDAQFPIGVPEHALDLLAPAGSREQAAMLDCLTDGPPQHSLANAAMVHLVTSILARLPAAPAR